VAAGMAKRRGPVQRWWQGRALRRGLRLVGRGVLLMGLLALFTAAVEYLLRPTTLPIRTVVIEGELRHQDRGELTRVMEPVATGGFFGLDLGQLERALQSLPWVRSVAVRRTWPDTVVVRLTEEVAVARWGKEALVTRHGELITPDPATFPQGLPRLHGQKGRHWVLMERYVSVQARLADVGLEVVGLTEDARRAWSIELADGVRVVMGRGQEDGRLDRLVRLYPHLRAHRDAPLRRIDLRYTNGVAVAWDHDAAPLH
jgi:cell division protein FtsQ